jgi:hypothetical protein
MILSPDGAGIQGLFAHAKPIFVWDAFRAGRAIGKGKDGSGRIPITITDNDARASGKWVRWSDCRLEYMSNSSNHENGIETIFGPTGEFYGGYYKSYTFNWTSSKQGLAVVSPTSSSALVETNGVFPSILKNPNIGFHSYLTHLDTTISAVNDVVAERSCARSSTYNRCLGFFIRNTNSTSPSGLVTLGWNTSSGTRSTSTTQVRQLPGTDWYFISIVVIANATTAGYASIKAAASSGVWQIACPVFYAIYSEFENISRFGLSHSADSERGKFDAHTANAELQIRKTGWLAMSIILPDRGKGNGHLDFSGASNYKFLGMLNLDCGTNRLRVSMSDSNDYLIVSLGDTSGNNFAYLDSGTTYWNDFAPIGLVATWEINNNHKYASLFINGTKVDSIADPVSEPISWYSDNNAPGTLYIGSSGADGTPAEAMIPRVAYSNTHMHRSYARKLSIQMRNWAMQRGGSALDAWGDTA